jgi:predicted nucleotidyltransferase
MIALLESKRGDLVRLCERYHVRRLELFGSASGSTFDVAASDLDFLVEFHDVPEGERANCYFGLLEGLEALFDRSIDLVEVKAIDNPYFLAAIERTRKVLYAA